MNKFLGADTMLNSNSMCLKYCGLLITKFTKKYKTRIGKEVGSYLFQQQVYYTTEKLVVDVSVFNVRLEFDLYIHVYIE